MPVSSPRASRSDHSLHYAGSSVEWIDATIRLEQPKLSHVVFRLSQGQRKPNGDVDRAASIADGYTAIGGGSGPTDVGPSTLKCVFAFNSGQPWKDSGGVTRQV